MRRPPCLFAILALAIGLAGCCEDCPVCPEPKPPYEPDYHLLYSYANPDYASRYVVLTYSLKTEAVVDCTYYAGEPFWDVGYLSGGEYSCYTRTGSVYRPGATWITQTKIGDTVAIDPEHGGRWIDISADEKYLVTSLGNELSLFSLPMLEPIYRDSGSFRNAVFHPYQKVVYYTADTVDSLFTLSFGEHFEVQSVTALRNLAGDPVFPGFVEITSNAKTLALETAKPPPYSALYLHILDAESFAILHEFPINWPHRPVWHPDAERLFLAYNGIFDHPHIGGVDVYDVRTGVLQNFISSDEVDTDPDAFVPSRIQFTPEGDRMIILNGGNGFWTGPILVVDMVTKQIIQKFEHRDNGFSHVISLVPIDWTKEEK